MTLTEYLYSLRPKSTSSSFTKSPLWAENYGEDTDKNTAQNSQKHAISSKKNFWPQTLSPRGEVPQYRSLHIAPLAPSTSLLDPPLLPPEFQPELRATASTGKLQDACSTAASSTGRVPTAVQRHESVVLIAHFVFLKMP